MMNSYALVENGVVVNIIVWDGAPYVPETPAVEPNDSGEGGSPAVPASGWSPPEGVIPILIGDGVAAGVGYAYDAASGTFIAPASEVPGPTVPSQVTMRQARLALLAAGKLAAVEAAIESLQSPQKEAARIEWDYSSTVERDSAIVAMLGASLEFDNETLDRLFIQAAVL